MDASSKPREFWIEFDTHPNAYKHKAYNQDMKADPKYIHVIEYSAFKEMVLCNHAQAEGFKATRSKLEARIVKLRAALRQYEGIAGNDCSGSLTKYSIAEEALAQDDLEAGNG